MRADLQREAATPFVTAVAAFMLHPPAAGDPEQEGREVTKMRANTDDWINALAVAFVVLLLPFYIGYIDSPLEIMLLYAVAGGFALAVGDSLLSLCRDHASMRPLLVDAGIYTASVLVFGLVPFGLAIWLI